MSMINLEKCQAIYNGNIANVVHSAVMQNGFIVNLGTLNSKEVYNVVVPATATLGSAEALLIFNDETIANDYTKTISDYSVAIGEKARAYHLTVGDEVVLPLSVLSGAATVGQYLIPANGVMTLAPAADLTGATRLALVVFEETTIGYANEQAWRARVIKA